MRNLISTCQSLAVTYHCQLHAHLGQSASVSSTREGKLAGTAGICCCSSLGSGLGAVGLTAGLGEIGLLGMGFSALKGSAALGREGVGVLLASPGCGFSFDPKQNEQNGKHIGLAVGRDGRLSRQLYRNCAVPNSEKVASRHVSRMHPSGLSLVSSLGFSTITYIGLLTNNVRG